MITVLRTRPGTQVRLFDGQGRSGIFLLEKGNKNSVSLREEKTTLHDPPGSGVVLALGWNKSKRRDWLLEKAVELGALGIVFWRARHSQGKPPPSPKENWQEKLIQSAKQCGSVFLPTLEVVEDISGVTMMSGAFDTTLMAWEKANTDNLLGPERLTGKTLVVFGPEGGFDEQETDALLEKDFEAVSLGNSILRWETAAIHTLSLALYSRERRT